MYCKLSSRRPQSRNGNDGSAVVHGCSDRAASSIQFILFKWNNLIISVPAPPLTPYHHLPLDERWLHFRRSIFSMKRSSLLFTQMMMIIIYYYVHSLHTIRWNVVWIHNGIELCNKSHIGRTVQQRVYSIEVVFWHSDLSSDQRPHKSATHLSTHNHLHRWEITSIQVRWQGTAKNSARFCRCAMSSV